MLVEDLQAAAANTPSPTASTAATLPATTVQVGSGGARSASFADAAQALQMRAIRDSALVDVAAAAILIRSEPATAVFARRTPPASTFLRASAASSASALMTPSSSIKTEPQLFDKRAVADAQVAPQLAIDANQQRIQQLEQQLLTRSKELVQAQRNRQELSQLLKRERQRARRLQARLTQRESQMQVKLVAAKRESLNHAAAAAAAIDVVQQ